MTEATTVTRPGVTAVIPTHLRPRELQRAVKSVLEQEYAGDIEVVVVFDACDPFTPAVETTDRRRLRTMANRRSRGLAGARNAGIAEASYGYVAFLDDDDYWLPGKLDAQMAVFERFPDVVCVGASIVVDTGDRRHVRRVPTNVVSHRQLLRDRVAGLHASTLVFDRVALTDVVGQVDEDIPGSYGEDWDLLLRTSRVAPIHVVDRALVSVSWTERSYFVGQWSVYADGLRYLLSQHPDFEDDPRSHAGITAKIAFACAASGQRREALRWARLSVSRDARQPKAWVAIAIACRLTSAASVVRAARRLGRGI